MIKKVASEPWKTDYCFGRYIIRVNSTSLKAEIFVDGEKIGKGYLTDIVKCIVANQKSTNVFANWKEFPRSYFEDAEHKDSLDFIETLALIAQ